MKTEMYNLDHSKVYLHSIENLRSYLLERRNLEGLEVLMNGKGWRKKDKRDFVENCLPLASSEETTREYDYRTGEYYTEKEFLKGVLKGSICPGYCQVEG